jgi:hypothetical protein
MKVRSAVLYENSNAGALHIAACALAFFIITLGVGAQTRG